VDVGHLALGVGALLVAGIGASLLAGRLRLPGLVLVLGVGMLLGDDVLGVFHFGESVKENQAAQNAAVIALALILYEGGLSSGWAEIRPVFGVSIALATLGTMLTASLTALAARLLFDELTTLEALLLGSTVAATDAAAVFAVLRGSTLRRKIARTLEGESGVNDPVAVLLVLGCIEAIKHPDFGIPDAVWLAVKELSIGTGVGLATGFLGVALLKRLTLPTAGLYPVASLALAGIAYGGADSLHGSGFLAAYLAGLVIGSVSTPARRTIVVFHEGVAWVAQLGLFLLLGLLVFPSRLGDILLTGGAFAVFTAVVARPLATLAVAWGFSVRERLMLGWAGLRGATPIVFAIFPVTQNVRDGTLIFEVAFFVVLVSTILQGLTIEPVARRLRVTADEVAIPEPLVEPVLLNRLGAETMQFPVRASDAVAGHPVRELGLPREALLNVIVRGDRAIPPRGSTVVQPGDQLHVLVRQEVAVEFTELMRRWRTGPVGPPERPRRRPLSRPSVTSIRPWQADDGDPSRPREILGYAVIEQLRTRRDEPGALVELEDGRYAVSGPLLAVGPSGELQAFARRRLSSATAPAERAWWREVVGALAR
jgi:cell volume regulation protein A